MEITTNLLTEEIFRISEIMLQTNSDFKINKTKVINVLTEATIPKGALTRAGKKLESVLKGRRFVNSNGQTVVDLESEQLFKSLETKLDNIKSSLNSATVDEGLTKLIEIIEKAPEGSAVAEKNLLRDLIKTASQFDMKYAVDLSDGFFTQFLERIKYLKDPANIGRRIENPPNSGNYIDPQLQARAEYENYFGKNFADNLLNRYVDSGKGLKQKIWEVKYANLNPKELTIWEKFINSKDLLIPELRATINLYLKALTRRNDKIADVINDIFGKIKIIEIKAQNLSSLDDIPNVQSIYKDIMSTIQTINTKGEGPIKVPDVFKEIRDVLITQGLDGGIARKIEEGLKKVESEQTKPGGPEKLSNAVAIDFLRTTSWAESLREVKRAKGFSKTIGAMIKRQVNFINFGSIKNMAEWRQYILKADNPSKGVFYAWLYLQVATRLGVPLIVATAKGLKDALVSLVDSDDSTTFFNEWGNAFKEQYDNLYLPENVWNGWDEELHGKHGWAVWLGQVVIPLKNYWPEIWDLIMAAGNYPISGQLSGIVKRLVEFFNGKKDEAIENITNAGNTEPWFRAWCLTNSKSYKGWVDTNPKYGVTTDDKKWKYNESTKGFDEITPTPSPTPVVTNPPVSTEKIIDNSEQGFKNWCEKTNTEDDPRIFKSYNYQDNGLGITKDNKTWLFNEDLRTFEEY